MTQRKMLLLSGVCCVDQVANNLLRCELQNKTTYKMEMLPLFEVSPALYCKSGHNNHLHSELHN